MTDPTDTTILLDMAAEQRRESHDRALDATRRITRASIRKALVNRYERMLAPDVLDYMTTNVQRALEAGRTNGDMSDTECDVFLEFHLGLDH